MVALTKSGRHYIEDNNLVAMKAPEKGDNSTEPEELKDLYNVDTYLLSIIDNVRTYREDSIHKRMENLQAMGLVEQYETEKWRLTSKKGDNSSSQPTQPDVFEILSRSNFSEDPCTSEQIELLKSSGYIYGDAEFGVTDEGYEILDEYTFGDASLDIVLELYENRDNFMSYQSIATELCLDAEDVLERLMQLEFYSHVKNWGENLWKIDIDGVEWLCVVFRDGDLSPSQSTQPSIKKETSTVHIRDFTVARLDGFKKREGDKLSETLDWILANKNVEMNLIYEENAPKKSLVRVSSDSFKRLHELKDQYKLKSIDETVWRLLSADKKRYEKKKK